jgi:hypothetical protein
MKKIATFFSRLGGEGGLFIFIGRAKQSICLVGAIYYLKYDNQKWIFEVVDYQTFGLMFYLFRSI